jgi:hypothetical protein
VCNLSSTKVQILTPEGLRIWQLSQTDRQTRLKRLYQFVANYDIDKWADSILTDIWQVLAA